MMGGAAWMASRLTDNPKTGHRRPILFGLWQPGPREREDVKARFEANLRRYGPQWRDPAWVDQPVWADQGTVHTYSVQASWSGNKGKYLFCAYANETHVIRRIYVELYKLPAGNGWMPSLARFSYPPWPSVASYFSESVGQPLNLTSSEKDPEVWTAADQFERAFRDALE